MSVIVAGSVQVDPADRARGIEGLRVVVEAARAFPGCLDVSISPDPIDPGRVNIFEHFESAELLDQWRAIAPAPSVRVELLEDRVRKHHVSRSGPAFD